jgi:mannose-1-phosphate guanylyltransferase
LVCYADNLTNVDLTALMRRHTEADALVTMGLFISENPTEVGIAELDAEGWVVGFEEKPREPKTNLANSGLYVMSHDILKSIPPDLPLDIGRDLIPTLIGMKIQGVRIDGYLRDIGTLESYRLAQMEWSR